MAISRLARITSNNDVSLQAINSIIDSNDTLGANTLNVQSNTLQMVATNGLIGNSDTGNTVDNNIPAIDTQVNTLAAFANLGIYVRELDGVTIDRISSRVQDVNFNSTTRTWTMPRKIFALVLTVQSSCKV